MFKFTAIEDSILNPTLWIGNFEWREPITTLTDLLTSMVCLSIFIYLKNYKGAKSESFKHYKYYFLFFFFSMFSAAWFGHGLQAYVDFDWKKIGWVLSSFGFLQIEIATLKDVKTYISKKLHNFLNVSFYIQFAILVPLMVYYQNFKIPQLNSTLAFVLFVLPLQSYLYYKTKNKGHLIIVGTILYAAIPGSIYNNKLSLSPWFNYHDISHVLMAVFMLLIFRGILKIAKV